MAQGDGQHGGYRRPAKPAAVSGPGSLSRRTDGGPADGQAIRLAPGGEYGSRKEMQEIQSSAPMEEAGSVSAPPPPRPAGLTDPSARPDEPVTAGNPFGAGIGPAAAGIQKPFEIANEQLRPLVHSLERIANLPSSNPETRTFVRLLKARLSNGSV